ANGSRLATSSSPSNGAKPRLLSVKPVAQFYLDRLDLLPAGDFRPTQRPPDCVWTSYGSNTQHLVTIREPWKSYRTVASWCSLACSGPRQSTRRSDSDTTIAVMAWAKELGGKSVWLL